jgi:hypothetical protein
LKKSKHSPKKLLPKQSRLSARFSKQNKIKRPEIKLKTSRCIFQLADLLYDKYEELRRIEDSWEDLRCKMFRNPASKIYTKELDALTEKRSALLKELEHKFFILCP